MPAGNFEPGQAGEQRAGSAGQDAFQGDIVFVHGNCAQTTDSR